MVGFAGPEAGVTGIAQARLDELTQLDHLRETAPQRAAEFGEALLDSALSGSDAVLASAVRLRLGETMRVLGRIADATAHLQAALAFYESSGDRSGEAWAHHHLATVCAASGLLDQALRHIENARDLFELLDEAAGMARALVTEAVTYSNTGRPQEGLQLAERAERIYRLRCPEREVELGYALYNRATPLIALGRPEEAREALTEALEIGRRNGPGRLAALALGQLGVIHHRAGTLDAARADIEGAMQLGETMGEPVVVAWSRYHLASIATEIGDNAAFDAHMDRALAVAQSHGLLDCHVACLDQLHKHYERIGDTTAALATHRELLAARMNQLERASSYNLRYMQAVRSLEDSRANNAELEERVSERTRELSETVDRLQREIARREEIERQVRFLAERDPLTRCPNRRALISFLGEMLDAAAGAQHVAVIFIDVDRFKQINDSLGHTAGDAVLCDVAQRLGMATGEGGLLSRYGGDEFVAVIPLTTPVEAGRALADREMAQSVARVRRCFEKPFSVGDEQFYLDCSIGASLHPQDGNEPESLIACADMAMYAVKQSGRGGHALFDVSLAEAAHERLALEKSLRHATERGEFELRFEPRVSSRGGLVVALEALLRWRHPKLGWVPPSRFIPIAEDTGEIVPIGRWVLEQACMHLAGWRAIGHHDLRIAVNVSARQIKDIELLPAIEHALKASGLPPDALELEVTESLLIEDPEGVARVLGRLKGVGVRISLDDFGMGYSNLAMLARMPLDILKLDRSLVEEMVCSTRAATVVASIVSLARGLGLSVVAEGVQDEGTRIALTALACESFQGYLFSQPMTAEEVSARLAAVG
ncbi:hypothetical protein GCM10025771_03310 [Niveibacterium umoris]|uniref:Diguanylate cyclase (GGDEF)-like protein n=1 Tax=Niveibacterium umoris TaxID=1193620 RepID=A0A840BTI8_9RHOO|nr:EAL domain-containing protein [Niveibacterium umoris]MBB4014126.1 diguanylate cyclase (GGDEF)-like protein [Niveibacterium umoris]